MSFVAFENLFHLPETRILDILDESQGVPLGKYTFWENYCNDAACDCRKDIVNVVSGPPDRPKIWATIHFGWENPSFYFSNFSDDFDLARVMSGSYLEPLGEQTPWAYKFLEIWKRIVTDDEYVDRLRKHYYMFKEKI
jgi:hypothetical protein